MPINVGRFSPQQTQQPIRIPTASIDVATLPTRTQVGISARNTQEGLRLQQTADVALTNSQLNKYKVDVLALNNRLDDNMRDNRNDPTTYKNFFEDYTAGVEGINSTLTTPEAQNGAAEWWNWKKETTRGSVELQTDRDSIANGVATYGAGRKFSVKTGDLDFLKTNSDQAVQLGIMSQQEADLEFKTDVQTILNATQKATSEAAVDNEIATGRIVYDDVLEEGIGEGKTQSQAESDAIVAAMDLIRNSEIVPEKDKTKTQNDLRGEINARRAEEKLALEDRQNKDLGDINQIMYIDKDYQKAVTFIKASSFDEKRKGALLKENDQRSRLAAAGEPETNVPSAVDNVSTAIAQVGNDTLPLATAKKILNANRANLKSEKVTEFTEELNKEFDRSVDTAYARVRQDVRLRAVGKTESALDRLIEGLVGVKADDQKSLEDRITTAREKFNLELDNFNRWEDSLRAWRRRDENRTAAPEKIQNEGVRSWATDFSGKTLPQLRVESELQKAELSLVRVEMLDGRTGRVTKEKADEIVERELGKRI